MKDEVYCVSLLRYLRSKEENWDWNWNGNSEKRDLHREEKKKALVWSGGTCKLWKLETQILESERSMVGLKKNNQNGIKIEHFKVIYMWSNERGYEVIMRK